MAPGGSRRTEWRGAECDVCRCSAGENRGLKRTAAAAFAWLACRFRRLLPRELRRAWRLRFCFAPSALDFPSPPCLSGCSFTLGTCGKLLDACCHYMLPVAARLCSRSCRQLCRTSSCVWRFLLLDDGPPAPLCAAVFLVPCCYRAGLFSDAVATFRCTRNTRKAPAACRDLGACLRGG